MKKFEKLIALFIIVISIIAIYKFISFALKSITNKRLIESVVEVYTSDSVQDILTVEEEDEVENNIIDDLMLEIDGDNIIGILDIARIGFRDVVYEGTKKETLDKGVCHMENSSFLEGNVCLAGHNTVEIFGNLNQLEGGDRIIYTSFLGKKEYTVTSITEIKETDWSLLQPTEENKITLITCIRNQPFKRLCVQAEEVE